MPRRLRSIEVLYLGDNIDSLTVTHAGYDFFFNNQLIRETCLEDVLKEDPLFSLKRLWGTAIDSDFPNSLAELTKYHVIILSDVGSDSIRLYPEVMKGQRGVDRLKLIREFVKNGGGLLMCGGYLSFGGYHNTARYHDTPVEEALPVMIKDGDDRVDVTDGFKFSLAIEDHPIIQGIDWNDTDFYLLGYNRLTAKSAANVLATYLRDPIVTVWDYGNGRSMAFASDCNLHWGGSFVDWQGYAKFWQQAIKWLAKQL